MTTGITIAARIAIALAATALGAWIIAAVARQARRRRAAEMLRRDEADFELRFPEGPDDRPVRKTVVGRRTARR
jgi:hypothetical protein